MVTEETTLSTEYATTEEAARILGVSRVTVLRWIRRGVLEAFDLGPRRLAIKRSDLAKVVRKHTPGGQRVPSPAGQPGKMTADEVARGRALLLQARALAARIAGQTPPLSWTPTWQLLNQLRDERAGASER